MRDVLQVQEILDWLAGLDLGVGLLLGFAGMIFLVYGWRIPRFLMAISFPFVFAGVGIMLELALPILFVLFIVGAFGGSLLAIKANRFAIALLAGVWAATLIIGGFIRIDATEGVILVAALLGFSSVTAMAVTSPGTSVAFVSSVEGSLLVIGGIVVVIATSTSWYQYVQDAFINNPIFLPFLILVGIATGYYLQIAAIQENKSGMSGA